MPRVDRVSALETKCEFTPLETANRRGKQSENNNKTADGDDDARFPYALVTVFNRAAAHEDFTPIRAIVPTLRDLVPRIYVRVQCDIIIICSPRDFSSGFCRGKQVKDVRRVPSDTGAVDT